METFRNLSCAFRNYLGISTRPKPLSEGSDAQFPRFSELPAELRIRIWELALVPRIVRRIEVKICSPTLSEYQYRTEYKAPANSLPLLSVSSESRATAFSFAQYEILSSTSPIYFSSALDYLWIDPGWGFTTWKAAFSSTEKTLIKRLFVRPELSGGRWWISRDGPTLDFGQLPLVEQILVAFDAKSIGFHDRIALHTLVEIKAHYETVVRNNPTIEIGVPHIAIGCFNWETSENMAFNQGEGNMDQLLAILEDETEMKAYLNSAIDGQDQRKERARRALRARISSSCIKDELTISLEGLGHMELPGLDEQRVCASCGNNVPNRDCCI